MNRDRDWAKQRKVIVHSHTICELRKSVWPGIMRTVGVGDKDGRFHSLLLGQPPQEGPSIRSVVRLCKALSGHEAKQHQHWRPHTKADDHSRLRSLWRCDVWSCLRCTHLCCQKEVVDIARRDEPLPVLVPLCGCKYRNHCVK